uniref:Uncharacterized protein n=1 Tax=Anguilla anguilla TaxID=7936 RepID=A0A0E9PDK4_ANGAN
MKGSDTPRVSFFSLNTLGVSCGLCLPLAMLALDVAVKVKKCLFLSGKSVSAGKAVCCIPAAHLDTGTRLFSRIHGARDFIKSIKNEYVAYFFKF